VHPATSACFGLRAAVAPGLGAACSYPCERALTRCCPRASPFAGGTWRLGEGVGCATSSSCSRPSDMACERLLRRRGRRHHPQPRYRFEPGPAAPGASRARFRVGRNAALAPSLLSAAAVRPSRQCGHEPSALLLLPRDDSDLLRSRARTCSDRGRVCRPPATADFKGRDGRRAFPGSRRDAPGRPPSVGRVRSPVARSAPLRRSRRSAPNRLDRWTVRARRPAA
jgi:hypothetical protein